MVARGERATTARPRCGGGGGVASAQVRGGAASEDKGRTWILASSLGCTQHLLFPGWLLRYHSNTILQPSDSQLSMEMMLPTWSRSRTCAVSSHRSTGRVWIWILSITGSPMLAKLRGEDFCLGDPGGFMEPNMARTRGSVPQRGSVPRSSTRLNGAPCAKKGGVA